MSRMSLQEWLRAAYEDAAECPPPESWLEDELDELGPADRQRLEDHADSCPRCASERELAQNFNRDELQVSETELQEVLRRRVESDTPTVVDIATRGPARKPSWLRPLLAAASVTLGIGLIWYLGGPAPPDLPDPAARQTARTAVLELLSPTGEIELAPTEFDWQAIDGAERYILVVSGVDRAAIWEADTNGPPIRVLAQVRAKLLPAVKYTWSIEAVDASGAVVGRSKSETFRIAPSSPQ